MFDGMDRGESKTAELGTGGRSFAQISSDITKSTKWWGSDSAEYKAVKLCMEAARINDDGKTFANYLNLIMACDKYLGTHEGFKFTLAGRERFNYVRELKEDALNKIRGLQLDNDTINGKLNGIIEELDGSHKSCGSNSKEYGDMYEAIYGALWRGNYDNLLNTSNYYLTTHSGYRYTDIGRLRYKNALMLNSLANISISGRSGIQIGSLPPGGPGGPGGFPFPGPSSRPSTSHPGNSNGPGVPPSPGLIGRLPVSSNARTPQPTHPIVPAPVREHIANPVMAPVLAVNSNLPGRPMSPAGASFVEPPAPRIAPMPSSPGVNHRVPPVFVPSVRPPEPGIVPMPSLPEGYIPTHRIYTGCKIKFHNEKSIGFARRIDEAYPNRIENPNELIKGITELLQDVIRNPNDYYDENLEGILQWIHEMTHSDRTGCIEKGVLKYCKEKYENTLKLDRKKSLIAREAHYYAEIHDRFMCLAEPSIRPVFCIKGLKREAMEFPDLPERPPENSAEGIYLRIKTRFGDKEYGRLDKGELKELETLESTASIDQLTELAKLFEDPFGPNGGDNAWSSNFRLRRRRMMSIAAQKPPAAEVSAPHTNGRFPQPSVMSAVPPAGAPFVEEISPVQPHSAITTTPTSNPFIAQAPAVDSSLPVRPMAPVVAPSASPEEERRRLAEWLGLLKTQRPVVGCKEIDEYKKQMFDGRICGINVVKGPEFCVGGKAVFLKKTDLFFTVCDDGIYSSQVMCRGATTSLKRYGWDDSVIGNVVMPPHGAINGADPQTCFEKLDGTNSLGYSPAPLPEGPKDVYQSTGFVRGPRYGEEIIVNGENKGLNSYFEGTGKDMVNMLVPSDKVSYLNIERNRKAFRGLIDDELYKKQIINPAREGRRVILACSGRTSVVMIKRILENAERLGAVDLSNIYIISVDYDKYFRKSKGVNETDIQRNIGEYIGYCCDNFIKPYKERRYADVPDDILNDSVALSTPMPEEALSLAPPLAIAGLGVEESKSSEPILNPAERIDARPIHPEVLRNLSPKGLTREKIEKWATFLENKGCNKPVGCAFVDDYIGGCQLPTYEGESWDSPGILGTKLNVIQGSDFDDMVKAEKVLVLRKDDLLFTVCHEGMNRSQMMRRGSMVSLKLRSWSTGEIDDVVMPSHGAINGADPQTCYEGVDESNHIQYEPKPLSVGLNDFEQSIGVPRDPRYGEDTLMEDYLFKKTEVGVRNYLIPSLQVSYKTCDKKRTALRKTMDDELYGYIIESAKAGRRVILACFNCASVVMIKRILENAARLGVDDLSNIYIISFVHNDPFQSAETPEDGIKNGRKYLAFYESFIRTADFPGYIPPRFPDGGILEGFMHDIDPDPTDIITGKKISELADSPVPEETMPMPILLPRRTRSVPSGGAPVPTQRTAQPPAPAPASSRRNYSMSSDGAPSVMSSMRAPVPTQRTAQSYSSVLSRDASPGKLPAQAPALSPRYGCMVAPLPAAPSVVEEAKSPELARPIASEVLDELSEVLKGLSPKGSPPDQAELWVKFLEKKRSNKVSGCDPVEAYIGEHKWSVYGADLASPGILGTGLNVITGLDLDDMGRAEKVLVLGKDDRLFTVCHEGMNRSQMMRRGSMVSLGLRGWGEDAIKDVVMPSHGSINGSDPQTRYEGMDDTNSFEYFPTPLPDISDAFEQSIGVPRDPRYGEDILKNYFKGTGKDMLNMLVPSWRVPYKTCADNRTALRHLIDDELYGYIISSAEAGKRVILVCFNLASVIMTKRILENAVRLGAARLKKVDLSNVYIISFVHNDPFHNDPITNGKRYLAFYESFIRTVDSLDYIQPMLPDKSSSLEEFMSVKEGTDPTDIITGKRISELKEIFASRLRDPMAP